MKREFDGGELVDYWEVPEKLDNASASGELHRVFEALLMLDKLSDEPRVSDLFATIFEAGYQLAASRQI